MDGEISGSESDPSHFSTPGATPRAENSSGAQTPKKKRHKSKRKEWNDKMDKRMDKMEKLVEILVSNSANGKKTEQGKTVAKRSTLAISDSDSDSDRDHVSLHANGSISDDAENVDTSLKRREDNLSQKHRAGLFDMFGDDAVVQKDEQNEGLILDESQISVLKGSYRCTNPKFLSSCSEDNLDAFPMDKDSEKWLEVHSLDPMVESIMVKRFGEKAAFSGTKTKSLFTQPAKMVEKIAYKGQQAARLGLTIQMYIQQALGNCLQELEAPEIDKDKSITLIKDIFAMSTKCLDQIGRAGAFHHIVRRAVSMTDTALYEQTNHTEFSNLPLSEEGVFGSGLEPLLKARKEKKKQVDELIPDVKRFDNKIPVLENAYPQPYTTDGPNYGWNSFRIPKVPREGNTRFQRGSRGRFGGYPRRAATSGRGRLARSDDQ